MAEGKQMGGAQRGIAFSTASALAVSVLILIVGAGAGGGGDGSFEIGQLVPVIKELLGQAGVVVFALGFIAAALSSMLTIPLGAALAADSVFSEEAGKGKEKIGADNPNNNITDEEETVTRENISQGEVEGQEGKKMPRWIYLGIMLVMVTIATIVIAANGKLTIFTCSHSPIFTADRSLVILIAQVFNGCLLPFFSICLLLCLNDPQFMGSSPQKGWANISLIISVTITLFLASNVILGKIFSTVGLRLVLALCFGLVTITSLCLATDLGRQVVRTLSSPRPLMPLGRLPAYGTFGGEI